MFQTEIRTPTILGLTALVLLAGGPLHAAGFLVWEQSAKAVGFAGAFTARADDASAIFHNPGGIAFQNERDFLVGVVWAQGSVDFSGAAPFPGPGVTEDTETLSEVLPHFYWVEPIGDRATFGLGINAPFGLSVKWKNPDEFTGRFISTLSGLTAIDLNPTIAWKATEKFGLAVGVVGRFSEVELENHQFTDQVIPGVNLEFAKARLEGGRDQGFGWNLGILHRYNNSFSWGLSYRSRLKTDYGGELTLTQISTDNPVIDGILQGFMPFGQKVPGSTSIEFPDIASLGVMFAISPKVFMEVDVNWTGWSSFDSLTVEIDSPVLEDLELVQDWDDVFSYRLGVSWDLSPKSQLRFGYIYDETPQPEKTVSPVLPDSNRNDFTIGYGYRGGRLSWDIGLMYVDFDERSVRPSADSLVPYFGSYSQGAWLLSATMGF